MTLLSGDAERVEQLRKLSTDLLSNIASLSDDVGSVVVSALDDMEVLLGEALALLNRLPELFDLTDDVMGVPLARQAWAEPIATAIGIGSWAFVRQSIDRDDVQVLSVEEADQPDVSPWADQWDVAECLQNLSRMKIPATEHLTAGHG